MTQRPWTPTKRRGPIAAEYSSPGPACVTLPPLIGNLNFFSSMLKFTNKVVNIESNLQEKPFPTRNEAERLLFRLGAGT